MMSFCIILFSTWLWKSERVCCAMGCGPSKSKQTPAAEKKYETYDKEESTNDPPISDPSQATGVSGKVGGRTTTVDAGGPALENNVPKAEQNASSGAKVSESRDARAVTKGSTAPVAKVSSEATASSAKPSAKASAKPEASKVVSSPQLSPSPNKRRHVHDAAGHTELISQVVGTGMHLARRSYAHALLFMPESVLSLFFSLFKLA